MCFCSIYEEKAWKKQSVVLAAYSYPSADSEYWKAVIKEGGKNIPYVIINPNSGPGEETDSNYARQLKENMKAGIKNIAYIKNKLSETSINRSSDWCG